MEDKVVRRFTLFIFILSILTGGTLFYLPSFTSYVEAKLSDFRTEWAVARAREEMSALDLLSYNTQRVEEQENVELFTDEIRLYLPRGVRGEEIKITSDPLERSLEFVVPESRESDLNKHPIIGSSKYISDMNVWEASDGLHVAFIMDMVIEPQLTESDGYCYVHFYKPKELYQHVVVIDAGHGGKKPGTVEKGYLEKDINLEIVKKMKEILDSKESVKVYYTRLEDVHVSLESRAQLAKDCEADLVISIHQNSVNRSTATTQGVQVLYDENAPESEHNSYAFAKLCKEEFIAATGCMDKGLVKGDDIYIIRESGAPIALVECGFMSNPTELDRLVTPEYQETIATALCTAIEKAFSGGF